MTDDSWRTATFRQCVVSKIDEAIRQSRMPTSRNGMEMENHVFQKAKTKEEYLGFVARLILHVREINTVVDMNNYRNILTSPLDSPDSIMLSSPASGSSSPPQTYIPQGIVQPYSFANNAMQVQGTTPFLKVIEEPVDRYRFRYKPEMTGTLFFVVGSLQGKTSDQTRKRTYPSVELCNFDEPAVIRCALYQYGRDNMAYTRQPHAHILVKKQGSDEIDDPHDVQVNPDYGYVANFHSMGIMRTKRKDIVPELIRKNALLKQEEIARTEHKFRLLTKTEEIEVNAFAEKESKSINLNIVCLRFDAFKVINNIYYPLCPPVYSNAIIDLKSIRMGKFQITGFPSLTTLESALTRDMKIVRMDHCTSPSKGGREIFILVGKVAKNDIKVRFYELDDEENEIWSDFGHFSDLDVHKQCAIVFKTPPYKTVDIDHQVRVYIELQRPSDGARSEPKDFTYTPCKVTLGKKRARYSMSSYISSDLSSDLPLTINNLPMDQQFQLGSNYQDMNMDVGSPVVTTDDLEADLKQSNIDSAEFDKLCNSLIGSDSFIKEFDATEVTNKDLESLGLVTDAPVLSMNYSGKMGQGFMHSQEEFVESTLMKQLSLNDQQIIDRVRKALRSFIKTNPSKQRVTVTLEHLFTSENCVGESGDNVLHLLISENDAKNDFLAFLLKVILNFQQTALVNLRNKKGQTALHLAVECCNLAAVEYLVFTKADVAIQDLQGNTALHIAAMRGVPVPILKLLLKTSSDVSKYINIVNYDGHTALHVAINTSNLSATKLLCWNHADVNIEDKKSGYTALHMAVAHQHLDIVNFLLDSTDLRCDKEDFRQCTALKLAKVLIRDELPVTKDIYNTLKHFMIKNETFDEADIKEEMEDIMRILRRLKTTPWLPDSLKYKYSKMVSFTENCLNEVCAKLDELRAVELIDNMVKQEKQD